MDSKHTLDLPPFELDPHLPVPPTPLEIMGVSIVDSPVGRPTNEYVQRMYEFVRDRIKLGLPIEAIRFEWMGWLRETSTRWPCGDAAYETWHAVNSRLIDAMLRDTSFVVLPPRGDLT